MKKRISVILLALCMALFLLPVQAFADDSPSVVEIDVGGGVTENDDYKIADDAINLRKDGVVYELTGTTDREIRIWGSNSPDPVKTFYLRLNNATVNGGISIANSNGAKLVIEVVDDTTNTVERIYAVDLSITGKGTLNASDLGVTQQDNNDSRHLTSALYINNTTINVDKATNNPSQWNGVCVLDGAADVTYTTNTDYAALALGQTDKFSHSLTMKGNSKLRCLHSNAEPSQRSVNGLEGFHGATITLQDNAYLEAQGRACSGEYAGCGVICSSDIVVKDSATLKATAQDAAVWTFGKLEVSGGKFVAKSTGSNGAGATKAISIKNAEAEVSGFYPALYSDGNVEVSGGKLAAESSGSNGIYAGGAIGLNNTEVKASGPYPALYASNNVIVENSLLTATSTQDVAVYSGNGTIALTNSMVDANGADDRDGIYSSNGVNVSGSWVKTTGSETLGDIPNSIENSVLFNGKDGKVIGDASLPKDATIAADMALDIPEGMSLTAPEGRALTNHGKVTVEGALNRLGTIICDGHDGDKLRHVPAKDATNSEEGNIEYWRCDVCDKYFKDAAAENEITQAETVAPKLPVPPSNPSYPVAIDDSAIEGGSVVIAPKSATSGQEVTLTPKADAGHELGDLAVRDAKGNELELTDNGDGTFSFKMPAGKVTVEAVFPVMTFPDVDYSQWYAPGVNYMAGKGLMTGYEGTSLFGVGRTLTRGELATILWRNACPDEAAAYDPASAKDETGVAGSADGQFYTAAANWAVENGVITGIVREDGSLDFAATEDVTFEQLATILARLGATPEEVAAVGSDLSAFLDGDAASDWSAASLKWAADKGLAQGYDTPSGKLLKPSENVARERVATVLARAFELGILK